MITRIGADARAAALRYLSLGWSVAPMQPRGKRPLVRWTLRNLDRLLAQGADMTRLALELAESPNRFLSTVQIGITLVGILAGAFGGATLATELAGWIGQVSSLASYADKIAFGIVVAGITYFSLVLGELVPKRIALTRPERFASLMTERKTASRLGGTSSLSLRYTSVLRPASPFWPFTRASSG